MLIPFHLRLATSKVGRSWGPEFTRKKTEAQRNEVTYSRSSSKNLNEKPNPRTLFQHAFQRSYEDAYFLLPSPINKCTNVCERAEFSLFGMSVCPSPHQPSCFFICYISLRSAHFSPPALCSFVRAISLLDHCPEDLTGLLSHTVAHARPFPSRSQAGLWVVVSVKTLSSHFTSGLAPLPSSTLLLLLSLLLLLNTCNEKFTF